MFKCPFCQSTDCEELRNYNVPIITPIEQMNYSYNDDLIDVLCHNCGIVTKIHPSYYKGAEDNESK